MDELFSPEIAELEEFIDSYVADDPTFDGGENANYDSPLPEVSDVSELYIPKEYKLSDDFQQELLEHQRNQTLNSTNHQVQDCETWVDSHLACSDEFLKACQSDVSQSPLGLSHQSQVSQAQLQCTQATAALGDHSPINPYSTGTYGPLVNVPSGQYPAGWIDMSMVPHSALPWEQGEDWRINNYHHVNNKSNGPRFHSGYNAKSQGKEGVQCKPIHTNGTSERHNKATYPNRPKSKPVRNQVRNRKTRDKASVDDSPNPDKKLEGNLANDSWVNPRGEESSSSRKSSQSSVSDGGTGHRPKIVSRKSKAAVRSWLQKEKEEPAKESTIERRIGELEISKDLPKFIELAQCYITDDQKLKEVAEMLCSKAMKNPRFGEKSALLCKEMSNHKLLGTKFRSAVLTVIQGQFKNRQKLLDKSVQNPRDPTWIGFVTYLVELYENLRTTSDERLTILVNPVYECFFLMLKEKKITFDLGRCLYVNLLKVGRVLEKASGERMSELIAEIRDKCVMASPTPAIARRNLLRIVELYARGWSVPLANESFDQMNVKYNDSNR